MGFARPRVPASPCADLALVIVSTAYVVPPPSWHTAPYYEIVAAPDLAPDAPRVRFVTRDPIVVGQALILEGSDQPARLTWHPAQFAARDAHIVRVLEAIV
jgi:hypothetical protein